MDSPAQITNRLSVMSSGSYRTRLSVIVTAGILMRLYFWQTTQLILEDALITFRYAENVAAGNGMVYNLGEHVMGTTTPLWTFILAAAKFLHLDLSITSHILNILFDSATCVLVASILSSTDAAVALLWALLFSLSPDIISISMSGMETSLLLFSMSVTLWGAVRKNLAFTIGIALVLLTRIDGLLFVAIVCGYTLVREKRWAGKSMAFAFLTCLPWLIFSYWYFGMLVPESLLAKLSAYTFNFRNSFDPFLAYFLPLLERSPWKLMIKNILFLIGLTGIYQTIRMRGWSVIIIFFFIVYCLSFAFSGKVIFTWYFIPAIFCWLMFLATGIRTAAAKLSPFVQNTRLRVLLGVSALLLLVLLHFFVLRTRIDKYAELQQYEDTSRREIGLWLRRNAPPGSTVFLEPLGYIGYYAGTSLRLYDEIGLVAPEVRRYRAMGDGWYKPCLEELQPEFVVQYTVALETNSSEGNGSRLFADQQQREWFNSEYQSALELNLSDKFPGLERKEKKFIVFRHTGSPRLRSPQLLSSSSDGRNDRTEIRDVMPDSSPQPVKECE